MSQATIHRATRDAQGRSYLTSDVLDISQGPSTHTLWMGPIDAPVALGGSEVLKDIDVPAGILRWAIGRFAPGWKVGAHRTNTWDFHAIMQGSVISILDDGRHELKVGDFLIMEGVDHAWEAGPDGYVSSIMILGTSAPAFDGPVAG